MGKRRLEQGGKQRCVRPAPSSGNPIGGGEPGRQRRRQSSGSGESGAVRVCGSHSRPRWSEGIAAPREECQPLASTRYGPPRPGRRAGGGGAPGGRACAARRVGIPPGPFRRRAASAASRASSSRSASWDPHLDPGSRSPLFIAASEPHQFPSPAPSLLAPPPPPPSQGFCFPTSCLLMRPFSFLLLWAADSPLSLSLGPRPL